MEFSKKDFKLPKRLMIFILFCIVIVMIIQYNFTIVSLSGFPKGSLDGRLSSLVIQNEMNSGLKNDLYDRIEDIAVLSAFYSTCQEYYDGKNVIIPENLFKDNILKQAGFVRIGSIKKPNLESKQALDLLNSSTRSIWYNPIVFSARNYEKTGRYPLVTDPVFEKEYPKMIIFIDQKNDEENIGVEICGRYVVFAPYSYFSKMRRNSNEIGNSE